MTRDALLSEHDLRASLEEGLAALAVPLPSATQTALLAYIALIGKWNRTYNLTAIREPAKMLTHHLLDSLAVLRCLDELVGDGPGVRLLDVGSCAGLPGIPLALARPQWQVTMLDPVHKKAAFVTQALVELRIPNARIEVGRVEDFRPPAPFAIVISRAFADLSAFAEGSSRHIAPGGRLAAMKGVHPDEELRELSPAFAVVATQRLVVPGVDGARHLVIMEARPA